MNVLHVIPAVAPRYGGPSRVIFDVCRALKDHGVNSLIATTDADGPGRLPVARGRAITYKHSNGGSALGGEGQSTIFFPRQLSEAFKYSRPLARWLDANVREFDLVHIDALFSHASLAAACACRRHGVPYIVRPIGSLDPWSLKQKWLAKRVLWHLGVKQMLHGAAAIHYTTQEERRLAEDALGLDRGVVIPLGVDDALLEEAEDCATTQFTIHNSQFTIHPPYVLVLSRLHPKKNLKLLTDVFLDVTRRNGLQDWRLVIAGDGARDYVAGLKRHVHANAGSERVIFTGWLDGADKIAALQGASLFALPSHQENFGLAVVEALACGVPVLISEHVNVADTVGEAGAGWVVPLDRTALAQTLAEALRDQDQRDARGAAGRQLVRERFTWPAVAEQLVQLYRTIVQENGGWKGENGKGEKGNKEIRK